SRDLPMPASPARSRSWPWPSRTSAIRRRASARCASRATMTGESSAPTCDMPWSVGEAGVFLHPSNGGRPPDGHSRSTFRTLVRPHHGACFMKLLLTSAGITNPSIRAALVELLGRPIAECPALVISTASYPLRGGPELAWTFIAGQEPRTPMAELGWASVGVLELTALPSLDRARWQAAVQATDVLLVNGGDTIYL